MFKQSVSRAFALAVIALSLAVHGCSSDPTEAEITLEDLLADLQVQMTSSGGGQFAASTNATRTTSVFETQPSESQFTVLGPNLNVFNWPIIQDVPITARWQGSTGETMVLSWPDVFDRSVWPDLDVAGGRRYGNTWVVYPAGGDPNNWIAQHTEWIRRPGEASGTVFPFEVKLEADEPCNECPIGQFIAGPSRHVTDQPEFRRRTVIKWFKYSDMSPWVWQSGPPGGPPPVPGPGPIGAPVLEEVHVFVKSVRTKLDDGTEIAFEDRNLDVDLLALRGNMLEVVNADVPRGTFTDVTVEIDPAQSFAVVDGERVTLHVTQGTVVVQGPIVIEEAPITTVTLDFDMDQSLSETGDGSWTLSPVVVLTITTG